MKSFNAHSEGFTLPVILIISLSVLVVGLSALQSVNSIRDSFDVQYYSRLANEASQAGVSRATYCLKLNNYQQTWGSEEGKPSLTQATSCTGTLNSPALSSLLSTPNVRVTFEVGNLEARSDGAKLVSATGKVERLQPGSTVVFQTNSFVTKKSIKPPDTQLGRIALGYYNYSGDGSYFATYGSDGNFRAAGSNKYGELGNGTTTNSLEPQKYILPAGKVADKAYTNFLSHGFQLYVQTTDGDLYGSGLGSSGQLGNGAPSTNNSIPQKFQLPNNEKSVYVGPNGSATFVITDANNVYAAGSCSTSLLGNGCTSGNATTPVRVALPTPNINDLNTIPDQQIVTDSTSVFILMKGGRVYGWGNNQWGQLADGTKTNATTPKQVGTFGDSGQPKAVQLAFDGDTIYIVDNNGDAWAAGRNNYGEMGYDPSTNSYQVLKKIPTPPSSGKVLKVSTDQWTAIFLMDTGDVYGVGLNGRGQIGNGSISSAVSSMAAGKFILPNGVKAVDIWSTSAGTSFSQDYNNTFVVGTDGRVYGAGSNAVGQLGIGSFSPAQNASPIAMQIVDGVTVRALSVTSGFGSVVILTDSNRVYTVGNNKFGQLGLGNGSTANTNRPAEALFLKSSTPTYIF